MLNEYDGALLRKIIVIAKTLTTTRTEYMLPMSRALQGLIIRKLKEKMTCGINKAALVIQPDSTEIDFGCWAH
jgi:hypothetical protein